jgi:hypothetical protein
VKISELLFTQRLLARAAGAESRHTS